MAQKTELGEPDAGGRSCPVPVPGSEFTLEVDTVIPAVGQTADFSFFGPGLAFDTATIYRLEADPVTLATQIPGVFAGGDLVTGPRSAVEAFAAGRRAALAIHCSLAGQPLPQELPPLASRTTNLIVDTTRRRGHLPPADARPQPGGADGPTGRRSGTGFHRRRGPRPKPPAASPAPAPSASRTAPFSSTMCQQFPYTEKELVRLLAGRGLADPLIPYSCHYCGLCQAVCPKDLHAGRPCLAAREALVARGKGPLPPHKGIQNYVKWGSSPTFALSRPDPATGKAARVFFPGCSLAGHATGVVKAAYAHLRRQLPDTGIMLNCCGAPSYFMGEKDVMLRVIRNVAGELEQLGAREVIVACTHCLPDLSGISPGDQNPLHLRSAGGGGPARRGLKPRPAGSSTSRTPAAPARPPRSTRRCAAWSATWGTAWRRWPTTGSAASAAAPAAWCPRWPRSWPRK